MRALVFVLALAGTAAADELPTIDALHPATLRIAGDFQMTVERVDVAIHSAPAITWVKIAVRPRRAGDPMRLPVDVPAGTRVIGLAIATEHGNAWGRAMPESRARDQHHRLGASALLQWNSTSADQDHISVDIDTAATIEIGLLLPPLAKLAIDSSSAVIAVDVDGARVYTSKKGSRREPIDLADVVGTVGPTKQLFATEEIAFVAGASSPSEFAPFPAERSMGRFVRDLDKATIRRHIKPHMPQLRHCFMQVAQWNPTVKGGGAILSFAIAASGDVMAARADESDLPDAVNECLVQEARRWEFPATDGTVVVNYPLDFKLNE